MDTLAVVTPAPEFEWIKGLLLNAAKHWLPDVPEAVLLLVIGVLITGGTALFKLWRKPEKVTVTPAKAVALDLPPESGVVKGAPVEIEVVKTPNPLYVLIPSIIGAVLGGPVGAVAPMLADGPRRAVVALVQWGVSLFRKKGG